MPEDVPPGLTPFVFSDPLGKRWPRLRTFLLITGVLVFFATVLFVETLFIAPRMTAPFSLRQLKGQLKSLQKQNPAVQSSTPNSLLWQKFEATKQATKKIAKQTMAGSSSAYRRGRVAKRQTARCGWPSIPTAIPIATPRSSNTPRKSPTFVRNGCRW